jgi:hypothetical protein
VHVRFAQRSRLHGLPQIFDELAKKSHFRRFRKKFEIKACESRRMRRTYRTPQ